MPPSRPFWPSGLRRKGACSVCANHQRARPGSVSPVAAVWPATGVAINTGGQAETVMPSADGDVGGAAEDLIAQICSRAFFKDFVVKNPKFTYPDSSSEDEAADVLVLFGKRILSIQVKARAASRKPTESEETYLGRLQKRIAAGAKQVKTTLRAIRDKVLTEVTTESGIVVKVPPEALESLTGIVVLDLPAEQHLSAEQRSVLYGGVGDIRGVPVHAFLSDEFDEMLAELDTLPDFLDYLAFRERMFAAGKLFPLTRNLDLLAAYKIHFDLRDAHARPEIAMMAIEDGLWEHWLAEYEEPRRRRASLNKPSEVVDAAHDLLHRSFSSYGQQHADDWFRMVYALADLTRVERRFVGERWLMALDRAATKGSAFTVCVLLNREREAFIIYAAPEGEDRPKELYMIACAAYVARDLRRVRAFATAPAGEATTMQMVFLEDEEFTEGEKAELAQAAGKMFGPMYGHNDYEFGIPDDETPAEPKTARELKAEQRAKKESQRAAQEVLRDQQREKRREKKRARRGKRRGDGRARKREDDAPLAESDTSSANLTKRPRERATPP